MSPDGPPPTKREPWTDERHGDRIADPYRWLEEGGDRVDEWVDRQNAAADASLESIAVRQALRRPFESLARTTEYGTVVPAPTGYFQTVKRPDHEQAVLTYRPTLAADREVLVDPNQFSEDGTTSMGWWTVSPAGERLAVGVTEGGTELFDITVLAVPSGAVLEELPDVGRTWADMFAWTPEGFYYGRTGLAGDALLEKEVRYHEHGKDSARDPLVVTIDEPSTWPILASDRDGRHLLVTLATHLDHSEVWYAAVGDTEMTPVITDTTAYYEPLVRGNTAYLRTDRAAPSYRFLELELTGDLEEVEPTDLPELVPERDAIAAEATLADDRLVVHYERAAVSELAVFDLEGGQRDSIELPGIGAVSGLSGDRDAREVCFTYESFDHPSTVYHADLATGDLAVLERPDVASEFDVTVEQIRYESADGTAVPMFVVHRADLECDGDNPTVLTGYGGFGLTQTPEWCSFGREFVRSGGVLARPNLRGGGAFGTGWHEAGRLANKQRTFDDMIAAAEYLIEAGYTSSDRLAIQGMSNGGLTVGSVMTQRPDLVAAVVCRVPLLDMLRYHSLLLGESWTTEYGSPDDPEAYGWLREYSPYHNVERDTEYPAVLFQTATSDTRVHPAHAWKMAARLQAIADGGPFLCKTYRDTGHGTGKPTWLLVAERLDIWAFLFDQLEVEYVSP